MKILSLQSILLKLSIFYLLTTLRKESLQHRQRTALTADLEFLPRKEKKKHKNIYIPEAFSHVVS